MDRRLQQEQQQQGTVKTDMQPAQGMESLPPNEELDFGWFKVNKDQVGNDDDVEREEDNRPPPCPEEVANACERINDADLREATPSATYREDITVDWPLSNVGMVQAQVQKSQPPQQRNPPRPHSRAVRDVPPTPLPPLNWQGYSTNCNRPTYASWSHRWQQEHNNSNSNNNNNNYNDGDNITFVDDEDTKSIVSLSGAHGTHSFVTTIKNDDIYYLDCRCYKEEHGSDRKENNNNSNALYSFSKNYDYGTDRCSDMERGDLLQSSRENLFEHRHDGNAPRANWHSSTSTDYTLLRDKNSTDNDKTNTNNYNTGMAKMMDWCFPYTAKAYTKSMTNKSRSNIFSRELDKPSQEDIDQLQSPREMNVCSIDLRCADVQTDEIHDHGMMALDRDVMEDGGVGSPTTRTQDHHNHDNKEGDPYSGMVIMDVKTLQSDCSPSEQKLPKTKKSPFSQLLKLVVRWSGWKKLRPKTDSYKFVKLCKEQQDGKYETKF